MILGKPTIKSVSDYIVAEGCPICGHLPGWLDMIGPAEIVLEGCGHVVNVNRWSDSHHQQGPIDASELEAGE